MWGTEDPQDTVCVKSRSGYVANIANFPLLWVMKLQSKYACLPQRMICSTLLVTEGLAPPTTNSRSSGCIKFYFMIFQDVSHFIVFEDDQEAISL